MAHLAASMGEATPTLAISVGEVLPQGLLTIPDPSNAQGPQISDPQDYLRVDYTHDLGVLCGIKLNTLFTNHGGDLSKCRDELNVYLREDLKFQESQIELVELLWIHKSSGSPGSGMLFRDVCFLSFCDKFDSPQLSSVYSWAKVPGSLQETITKTGIFDLAETTGKISKVGLAVSGALRRVGAISSLFDRAKTVLAGKQSAAGPSGTEVVAGLPAASLLIATPSSRAMHARLEWQKEFYGGHTLPLARQASDKLITELLDQKTKGVFEFVPLHKCGSQEFIQTRSGETSLHRSGTSTEGETVSVGGIQVTKTKVTVFDGDLSGMITRENISEVLDCCLTSMSVARHVKLESTFPYSAEYNRLLKQYGDKYFPLLSRLEYHMRHSVYTDSDRTKSLDDRFLEIGSREHKGWEEFFFRPMRDQQNGFAAGLVPPPPAWAVSSAPAKAVSAPRVWNQMEVGSWDTGLRASLDPWEKSRNGLIYINLCPHRNKLGCRDLHYEGVCKQGSACQFSHICPMVSCGGQEHSFKMTHRGISWTGQPLTSEESGPYSSQGKGSKGSKGKGQGKGAKGGKAPQLALPQANALALANTPWPYPSANLKKEKR